MNKRSNKRISVSISNTQRSKLASAFMAGLFDHQLTWYQAGKTERIRNILKSRQIGATSYFAHEAFLDALETGRNQIFLAASKGQAHQFKSYIQQFAYAYAGIELKGKKIVLPNKAELIFLGSKCDLCFLDTECEGEQIYHGNLYVDEYFWFNWSHKLKKWAADLASQNQYRQTYFSTPSSLRHEAYPFWSGASLNCGEAKSEQMPLDVSYVALGKGRRCEDGQWRQIVTIEDAQAGGCNLFGLDLDQLRLEFSPDEWLQLFYCQFIDGSHNRNKQQQSGDVLK
ncbi:terminase large subunit domain-containing protein [Iodobacter sp.]|uniref:terminase large subunit domain-containing protein n=1 Tax=Iodobacter sp. TaxID=1915058 RepID=UPI0026009FE5|nr:terminase family protein [Iodobacter sp.]